jgi:acyl transferase domain-containing protein/acyl carrier protein
MRFIKDCLGMSGNIWTHPNSPPPTVIGNWHKRGRMTLNPQEELLERARKVIRELREKLAAAEAPDQSRAVAIIGLGLRFPGSGSDPEQFWRMIAEGRDAVKLIPPDRWDRDAFYSPDSATPGKINTRYGAFLDDVRRFDAAFFDITPREAIRMDPQQRIFLETAWQALEDAGLPKLRIAGSDAGVFVGIHSHSADYHAMQFDDPGSLDAYAAPGTAHDMIAGRLAYWLDLHGPAVTVDTACSSSLTAVHVACRSLRAGDCDVAIAGGVNLLLRPVVTVAAAQLHLLSPDGRCKAFDAAADGMGRGEGCGVVILKMLDAALRDGDRVLAILRGSAVNQDGKTNGLTAPNGLAQQRVIRRALQEAKVQPWEIGYVEAHGTGTVLGDPIEVEALAEVLAGGQRTTPCTLGAVKANVGHLEGAAGIAGLIKTVLVLQHRWLPPVANLDKLNPHLALQGIDLNIPQRGREWVTTGRRLAGVSAFGWSGTNVHVVLEEAPESRAPVAEPGIRPVLVSAQSPEALRILLAAFADRLESADESEVANISYTSTVRRTHHAYRVAVMGTDTQEMAAQLRRRSEVSQSVSQPQRTGGSGPSRLAERILAWEAGEDVDWQAVLAARGSVVDLPRYPFQGRSYWLDTALAPAAKVPDDLLLQDPLLSAWFYSSEWLEMPLLAPPAGHPTQPATWLLLHSGEALAVRLAKVIRQRGDRAIDLRRGERQEVHSRDEVSIGRDLGKGLKQFLAELTQAAETPQYAVYLAAGSDAAGMTAEVLEIVQCMIRSGISLKLWFVTRGAEMVEAGDAGLQSPQAAVRGFSRVFGLEHPMLAGGCIDTDTASSRNAEAVCEEIARATGEDRVVLREGRRWVARLRRNPPAAMGERLQLRSDRCYLLTGAFGRLGMEIASWLIDRGARHLALVGRRDPSEMGNPVLLAKLEDWRARGITVLAEACDVANESQVRSLLARINARASGLAGVIHAAAGVRFSPIPEALPHDVEVAFRAKLEGARVLDRCTRAAQLTFFVLFSSAASTIGLRNGALYAAANACLEAIASERRALVLPALCVEWGSWEHQEENRQQELIGRSGFAGMRPDRALRALETTMASDRSVQVVADIDWNILGPALEARGRAALSADLIEPRTTLATAVDVQEKAWLEGLANLPPQERTIRLLDFVGGETRKVFGMMPQDPLDETRGLFQLGMDSLMSVKLKRRLEAGTGLRLPGTLTLTYPTITALAGYLEEKLFPSTVLPSSGAPPLSRRGQDESFSVSVAGMSESEINAAIAAELAAIQQKLGVL